MYITTFERWRKCANLRLYGGVNARTGRAVHVWNGTEKSLLSFSYDSNVLSVSLFYFVCLFFSWFFLLSRKWEYISKMTQTHRNLSARSSLTLMLTLMSTFAALEIFHSSFHDSFGILLAFSHIQRKYDSNVALNVVRFSTSNWFFLGHP